LLDAGNALQPGPRVTPFLSSEEGQGVGSNERVNIRGGKGFGSPGGAKKKQQSGFSRAKEETPENFPQMQAGCI
jgi:hypothetical protein